MSSRAAKLEIATTAGGRDGYATGAAELVSIETPDGKGWSVRDRKHAPVGSRYWYRFTVENDPTGLYDLGEVIDDVEEFEIHFED